MRNLKLIIEYDGSHFSGFQVQPGKMTVQGEIENILNKLTKEKVRINGSGRTDSGVHALYQVVNFKTGSDMDSKKIKRALNNSLNGIMVKEIKNVPLFFDARRSAKKREYVYLVYNDEYLPFLLKSKTHHIKNKLDINKMKKASRYLIGKHDFSSFCAKDKVEKSSVPAGKKCLYLAKNLDIFGDLHYLYLV